MYQGILLFKTHSCNSLLCFQVKLSICGKDFWLTLIARRSRHCAGTRLLTNICEDFCFLYILLVRLISSWLEGYSNTPCFGQPFNTSTLSWLRFLKRGVNEKGRVANDVELEQIVFEDISKGVPAEITSIVQNRGSIPLFWSQETSKLNIRPDIICKLLNSMH